MEKSNLKVVFMGTPDFAVPSLDSLYESGYSLEAVVTQRDKRRGRGKKLQYTPVKERALELGIEVLQPDNINDEEIKKKLIDINPDFIIVVAYGQILKEDILNIPKYGCYNVHASLLPKYRGAAPINWVIINGESETGITIMEMEAGLDTGDMILSSSIPIGNEDTTEDIHDRLSLLGGELIVEALERIVEEDIEKTPQDHSKSSYASMLNKEIGRINWQDNGQNIVNLIRGLKPWPSAYTEYKGDIIKIHKASLSKTSYGEINGEIKKVANEGIYVNVSDGSIIIEEIQFPGKRKLKVSEYLKGNSIDVGTILK